MIHFSRSGDDITISGANLHIVNGTGLTDALPNGLGNVIIGYNEEREITEVDENDRSGSHMLVVGTGNNYSSYGGIVVGEYNTASGPWSSVSGGGWNEASGRSSSVSGGHSNTANRDYASVSGGAGNRASGTASVV